MKKGLFILFLVIACASRMLAADSASDFAAANQLYAEGKFSAAAGYENILQAGVESPALLFNDASAEFKAGNLGRAIAAFRRAELLAPRDPEIRANLQFVRNQVQGATVRENRWQGWLGQLTLNNWTWLAAVAFWLFFGLLIVRQLRPALAPKLKTVTACLAWLTVLTIAALGWQTAAHFNRQTAVVTADQASARTGPFDDAQNTFMVRDGAELSILDHHADWVQVTDGAGKIGWLNKKQVEILPGA